MSDVASLTVLVNGIYENAVNLSDLTGVQRKELEKTIHPIINGYRAWKGQANTNYAAWEVGDEVLNIDSTGKRQVLGAVIAVPFDPSAGDIDDRAKFDLYQDNSPAI